MSARRSFAACFLALFLTATLVHSVQSQPIWIVPEKHHRILLEWLKPDFEGGETTFGTGTWFLSALIVASDAVTLVAEVPYTHFAAKEFPDDAESDIGNVYLGLEFHGNETPVTGEIGVRLPTAGDEGVVGVLTDFVDRMDAFVTDAVPVCAFINFRHRAPDGFVARIRGGLNLWIPREDRDDTETFVLYGGQIGYAGEQIDLLAGVTGRWFATSEGADFGEASYHQFALAVDLPLGVFQPGVSFRVPLDKDLGDIVNWVLGLTVAANLGP
jgi:hypothetical protein